VNAQIVKLFGLFVLLFALLIGFTTRWSVLEASELKDQPSNRRALIEEQTIPRGIIYARDARTELARNVVRGARPSTPRARNLRTFTRTYPEGPLFGHPLGYSYIENGRRGIEQSENDALAGEEDEFETIFTQLRSKSREGRDVVTTLDPAGQREAIDALGSNKGAIVAMEPQTGRVRVMASTPTYDPNQIPDRFRQINTDPGKPLLNRATQEGYPPGSTFKVVTAAAALDTGKATPEATFDGSSPQTISGVPLNNFGGQSFGPVSFTEALTNSVNTVFARLGERVGRRTLIRYMERFGFNQDPPLDYPGDQMIASGVRGDRGQLLSGNDGFDVGRVAIGQGGGEGQILVTPMQMAMVAAAVGNGGRLMRPRLVERVVAKDGRVTDRVEPSLQSRVMSPRAAGQLAQMMGNVVREGTGTAAALSGIEVAGKTGTAEVRNAQANQPWFIAFAPASRPRMAIAVTLQDQPQGATGGQTAAPVAKRVLERLLGGGAGG
jgi:peptidoglycan glycosyltransferase